MYQHVMVPLDGSELAECVLPHVKTIAIGCNIVKVTVVRVVAPLHIRGGMEVRIPQERVEEYKKDLKYLKEELECRAYTDRRENVEKWDFFDYISLDDMAKKLPEYDLIIPF